MYLSGKRKTLITGSVPTEKIPEKSHDIRKPERSILQRKTFDTSCPSTSTAPCQQIFSIDNLNQQLQQKNIHPWLVDKSNEEEVRLRLYDEYHSIAKCTIVVNSALEFSIFVYNWPVPDQNPVYKERKRSVMYLDIAELLKLVETSCLCEGLEEDDDVMSVAVDPIENPDPESKSVYRHSVPKTIPLEEPHFAVSLFYRTVACQVLTDSEHSKKSCKTCVSALNAMKRAAKLKTKASSTPAKPRASLAACGPEKLRATVISSRLQIKDL